MPRFVALFVRATSLEVLHQSFLSRICFAASALYSWRMYAYFFQGQNKAVVVGQQNKQNIYFGVFRVGHGCTVPARLGSSFVLF